MKENIYEIQKNINNTFDDYRTGDDADFHIFAKQRLDGCRAERDDRLFNF